VSRHLPEFADLIGRLDEPRPRVFATDAVQRGDVFAARVAALADALAAGGAARIASRLDNGADWLALDLAIRRLGAVHVPLPTFFSDGQIAHALAGSGADTLVLPAAAAPQAAIALDAGLARVALPSPPPVALPAGTACITYTSGTTGTPKGVCLDATALLTVATSLAEAARPLAPRRHLCLLPLSTLLENVAGIYAALIAGAEIAVPSLAEIGYSGAAGLDVSKLLACLLRYQPHSAIVLPQLLAALVGAIERGAPRPESLRFLAVGGARVAPALLARAAALGLPVYEGYGLSECGSVVCLNRPGAIRPGSVGRPLPHARVEVVDGELIVDGVRCLGYLGADGPPPGPIATGDLGHVDADGYVFVTGRRSQVFITAFGRNVSPEWVESELLAHPAFVQAAVFGEARPFNVAVVVSQAGDAALERARVAVNRGLPDYARIGALVRAERPFGVADGLLTANGRPRRSAIAARYAEAITACYANAPEFSEGAYE
jgi:long-chain acyl-CoA synthetase